MIRGTGRLPDRSGGRMIRRTGRLPDRPGDDPPAVCPTGPAMTRLRLTSIDRLQDRNLTVSVVSTSGAYAGAVRIRTPLVAGERRQG